LLSIKLHQQIELLVFSMDIVAKFGRDDLAILYIAKNDDKYIEFVESLQPPITRCGYIL